MKPFRLILLFAILPIISIAQIDTSAFNVSGYFDFFYSKDFNKNYSGNKQAFLTSYNLANQFALNLALVQLEYEKGITTFHLGLQAGSFANFNYPESYRYINEAYIDLRLNRSESLTFSAGIFPSHLGFESAIAADNVVLSQSLASENSPYYLLGARLDYAPSNKWNIGAVICNGWQEIEYVRQGPLKPSIGSYISFAPTENLVLNWSTYLGSITGNNGIRNGFFNNIYLKYQLERLKIIAGYDYGVRFLDIFENKKWSISSILMGYKISEKFSLGLRGEYLLEDRNDFTASPLPYQLETGILGASMNLDLQINETIKFRVENRYFSANFKYFSQNEELVYGNNAFTASISARF